MSHEVTVSYRQVTDSASEGGARNHRITCDRPEEKGGGNLGPMGGELFLLGLGGCFMSNLLAAINARSAFVADVKLNITGTVDGSPARFTAVHLEVSATYKDREEMEKLLLIAERSCLVANTLKGSAQLSFSII
jgi:putative redox protein